MRRTRELLKRALERLLQRKGLDEILVQDITEEATVNRATFYAHYADKFALFEAIVAGNFHKLLRERNVYFNGTCPSGLNSVVLAVCDYLVQTRSDSSPFVFNGASGPLFDAAITAAIRRVVLAGVSQHGTASEFPPEAICGLISSAIYGAAKEWLALPNHPPAEKIAPSVVGLLLPILQAEAEPTVAVRKKAR